MGKQVQAKSWLLVVGQWVWMSTRDVEPETTGTGRILLEKLSLSAASKPSYFVSII